MRGEQGRGEAPLHRRMPVNKRGRNDGIRKIITWQLSI